MFLATVIGHLGADAEVKDYNGKKFVSFRVAHSERFRSQSGEDKERTQWVSCALNGDGGNLLQYLKRGQQVAVIGDVTLGLANSQVMRSMVPTCNIHVVSIELLGSSPSNDIPRQLATESGQLINTLKFFSLSQEEFNAVNPNHENIFLFGTRGDRYILDSVGMIYRDTNEPAPATEQPAEEQTPAPEPSKPNKSNNK